MDIDQKNLLPNKKIEVTLKQDAYFDKSDKNINVLTFRENKQSFFFFSRKEHVVLVLSVTHDFTVIKFPLR